MKGASELPLVDRRCCNCNHLLGRGVILSGKYEQKCSKCGTMNTLIAEQPTQKARMSPRELVRQTQ